MENQRSVDQKNEYIEKELEILNNKKEWMSAQEIYEILKKPPYNLTLVNDGTIRRDLCSQHKSRRILFRKEKNSWQFHCLFEKELKEIPLNEQILTIVREKPGCSITKLVELIGKNPSSIRKICKSLSDSQKLKRSGDERKGYSYYLNDVNTLNQKSPVSPKKPYCVIKSKFGSELTFRRPEPHEWRIIEQNFDSAIYGSDPGTKLHLVYEQATKKFCTNRNPKELEEIDQRTLGFYKKCFEVLKSSINEEKPSF